MTEKKRWSSHALTLISHERGNPDRENSKYYIHLSFSHSVFLNFLVLKIKEPNVKKISVILYHIFIHIPCWLHTSHFFEIYILKSRRRRENISLHDFSISRTLCTHKRTKTMNWKGAKRLPLMSNWGMILELPKRSPCYYVSLHRYTNFQMINSEKKVPAY